MPVIFTFAARWEGGENMNAEPTELADLVGEVSTLDDSALAHAVRRVHQESTESRDPVAAFGAFNQHSSSPW